MTEMDFSSKISELMTTLDQVKKYRELARSMGDFILILLSALVIVLSIYIGFDFYQGLGWQPPQNLVLSGVETLAALVIFGGAFISGILWVDRRVKRVRVDEWKSLVKEVTIGAMKLLSGLNWPDVFQEIRYSKLGFVFYGVVKIVAYWILASIVIGLASSFILYGFHAILNLVYTALLSLLVVLVLNRNDLQKRYNQSWALESLLWELRWFDSEFRGKAEFGEASATT